jgi:hypothetical protein
MNIESVVTHTPGPWKHADRWGDFGNGGQPHADAPIGQASRFSYAVADDDGFVVAHCCNPLITMDAERSEANARLIAACPNMYDYVKMMADGGCENAKKIIAGIDGGIG